MIRAVLLFYVVVSSADARAQAPGQDLDAHTQRELQQAERLLQAGRTRRARLTLRRSLRRAPSLRAAQLATRLLPVLPAAAHPSERAHEDAAWILEALAPFSGAEAERARAWTLAVVGRHTEAIDAVRVRAQEQASATRLQEVAALFVARDALRDAERAMQRALRIMPQSREIQLGLAALLVARGQPEQAVQRLLTVLGLDPNDHVARRDLAGALMAAGRHEEAMSTLRHLVGASEDPADELLLADAALELGRHRVAERAARRAIAGGATSGHSTLALALAADGRDREARRALSRAPDDARARRARRVLGENAQ